MPAGGDCVMGQQMLEDSFPRHHLVAADTSRSVEVPVKLNHTA